MTIFKRFLELDSVLKRKSLFLLGPRQTGKTTYLSNQFGRAYVINLLKPAIFLKFKTNPGLFGEEIEYQIKNHKQKSFIVDEIQKAPELLDEVHNLIETHKSVRFILTGSSAKKLKKTGVNLLGGRASRFYFHPIVSWEYGFSKYEKDLVKNLTFGFLPHILNSKSPWTDLEDYVALYLKEEIQQEAAVRSLEGFSRFLNTVALTNAQQLNFTELGSDAQVAPRTVREYYQVLEDTLIGHLLPAFEKTVKRKAMTTAKFYLFDPGVTNFLLGRKTLSAKTPEFGTLLEQTVFCEIKAFLDYHGIYDSLFYWRSTSLLEVDFVIKDTNGEWIGIEVKASADPKRKDFSGLLALEEELPMKTKMVVCQTKTPRLNGDNIEIIPIRNFLEGLWSRKWI